MKIFVSSRMEELRMERKIAIDNIHFAGHTPLYIETEPMVKDQKAKIVMDSLVHSADALVSIHYLSEGRKEPILNNLTPIEYELKEFLTCNPDSPVFLIRKVPDKFITPSPNLIDSFEQIVEKYNLQLILFEKPEHLASKIVDLMRKRKLQKDKISLKDRLIIRYNGPDFIGLIGATSEVIFTDFKMNIDYISHASRGGLASLYITCSPREKLSDPKNLRIKLIEYLKKEIKGIKEKGFDVEGFNPNVEPQIMVNRDLTKALKVQFYIELRTIDAPGQLNAICKVIKDLKFNIDELQQKPTPPEYERQATIIAWLSKRKITSNTEIKKELVVLETSVRNLVGVRAFSIRVIRSYFSKIKTSKKK